jgi:hypothetical protein
VYHNTVVIDNQSEIGTGAKAAYYNTATVAALDVDVKNNIFYINSSSNGTHYGIWFSSATPAFTSNHNAIVVVANGSTGIKAAVRRGTTNYLTLADWKAAFNNDFDQNSIDTDPVLTSPIVGNLTPLAGTADNLGTSVGITTDLTGATRSATTPDLGAIEFTGVSSDLAVVGTSFLRGNCYSANDTIQIRVKNTVGGALDMSTTPIVVTWNVTGPVNSNGTLTSNTGSLAAGAELTLTATTVNMSQRGTYTLNSVLGASSFNTVALNDSFPAVSITVNSLFTVLPSAPVTITDNTDTVSLSAQSQFLPNRTPYFSEMCHFRGSITGVPVGGWPTYLLAGDYLEITGTPGSNLGGMILEQYFGTTIAIDTLPSSMVFSPNGTLIIAVGELGSSVADTSNFYYHNASASLYPTQMGSITPAGRILRSASGSIVDAVAYGNYTFPATTGVTANDWSGTTVAGNAGIRLVGAYTKSSANWVNVSTTPQTPNVMNPGTSPVSTAPLTGFTWSLNGTTIGTSENLVVGPYAASGTFTYVATYNTGSACGTLIDSVTVTAVIPVPTCPITTTPTATGGIACGPNGAVLSATAGDSTAFVVWSDSSNAIVGTGNTYTTSPLTANYNFKAHDAKVSSANFSPGPPTSIAAGGFGNFSNGQYFTAISAFYWDSVTFRANGAVNGVIRVWDSNPSNFPNAKLIQSKNFSVSGAGDIQVPVDMAISPGSYYVNIGFTVGSAQLWRSTGGAVYPYTVPGVMSIDSAWLGLNSPGNLSRVYYFLDWKVSEMCFGTGVNALATYAPSSVTTLPYAETFTTGIACDWTRTQNTGSTGWKAGNAATLSSTYYVIPANGDFVASNDDTCNCNMGNDRLITPAFNFGSFGALNNLEMTFDYFLPGNYGSRGTVLASTDGGVTYNLIDSLPSTSLTAWGTRTVNLNSLAGQTNVRFAFRHNDGGQWADGFALDDVNITTTCAGTEVTVEVITDIFGTETTWSLRDATTNAIYATGGPYPDINPYNVAAATHVAVVCVPDSANVIFRINDSYGDGLFDGTNTGTFDVSIDCGGTQTTLFDGGGAFPYGGGAANVVSWDSLNFQVVCPPAIPQVSVTFQVDMSRETVSPNGIHIAGSFQGWNPSATPMVSQGNGIYTYTATVDANTTYEYKFINGNQWGPGFDEAVPAACAQNNNRFVVVDTAAITTPMVCFGRCEACGVNVFEPGSLGSAIRMYPNPTNAETHIAYEFQTPSDLNVTVYDARGKMVSQIIEKDITTGTIKLNVQNWSEGIYHVRMFNGSEQISRQLVVTK